MIQKLKPSCIARFVETVEAVKQLALDKKKQQIIIAIDGRCASGKTTLGYYLQELFDANLFHMDDFFLQSHQRTKERLAEIGGNVDYERFKAEILEPLLKREDINYRRFDCKTMTLAEEKKISAKRINIIEGSYCMNPYFRDCYDLRVFTDIDTESQLENIRKRNGEEKLTVFQEVWIPKEEVYFAEFQIKEKCEIVVNWKSL